ncbi:MAG: hypothetical protein KAW56_01170 [Candidatus Marinimicrobia bacterium]|nr:hypothetical protein [Candidatus Neomarinimicrobiota bacterium]
MALKHIARYRAMVTGHTVEEEMAVIKAREKGSYKKLFGVKDEFRENKLGGKNNGQKERF